MKAKVNLLLFICCCFIQTLSAQVSGTLVISGDINKYYPVTFTDGAWLDNRATELEIGRSTVHQDANWHGSLIAKFRFHVTNWGHGSSFIDADIRQDPSQTWVPFVAGWKDASGFDGNKRIIIWLRGNTSYYYHSNYAVAPVAYVTTPFQETGGPAHTFKTAEDPYVNRYGISYPQTAYFTGPLVNYFAGSVGVGTAHPGNYKLAVDGAIGARRIKVTQETWADFVFAPEYQLPSLYKVEEYLQHNRHLPGIPSAAEVKKEGLDLGDMNKKLLQKVEELTLYMIQQQKKLDEALQRVTAVEMENREIKKELSSLN